MKLQVEKIRRALEAQPLCSAYFTTYDRTGRMRCAVGALVYAAGVSDDELEEFQNALSVCVGDNREAVADVTWRKFGPLLQREYGFAEPWEIDALFDSNDDALFLEDRLPHVLECVNNLAKEHA